MARGTGRGRADSPRQRSAAPGTLAGPTGQPGCSAPRPGRFARRYPHARTADGGRTDPVGVIRGPDSRPRGSRTEITPRGGLVSRRRARAERPNRHPWRDHPRPPHEARAHAQASEVPRRRLESPPGDRRSGAPGTRLAREPHRPRVPRRGAEAARVSAPTSGASGGRRAPAPRLGRVLSHHGRGRTARGTSGGGLPEGRCGLGSSRDQGPVPFVPGKDRGRLGDGPLPRARHHRDRAGRLGLHRAAGSRMPGAGRTARAARRGVGEPRERPARLHRATDPRSRPARGRPRARRVRDAPRAGRTSPARTPASGSSRPRSS